MTNDDEKFRSMLRGLGKDFYHGMVTSQQVEEYISTHTGLKLDAFFEQYLRTTDIPKLEYYIKEGELNFRFTDVVPQFTLPITVSADEKKADIKPGADWQKVKWDGGYDVKFSNDFLIKVKK
jgi:aminopeptidase N